MRIQFHASERSLKSTEILATGVFTGEKAHHKDFSGKSGETLFVPNSSHRGSKHLFLIGFGKKDGHTLEKVRQAAARVLAFAKSMKVTEAAIDLDSFAGALDLAEVAGAATEGLRLANYRFDHYLSKPAPKSTVESISLVSKNGRKEKEIKKAVDEAEILSDAVYFTRDLANEPSNIMVPPTFAARVTEMAKKNNLICKVLGKKEMEKLKMGGVLGVSQGSAEPPQFVIVENKVVSKEAPIVLVGKGITFDTGGISIKPGNDMDKMKFDMCGAAGVMGAMKAIANLKIPVKVIAITPVCENMPDGMAQRPGDVIRAMNGKTIEVLNTDAEGRLILADALAYAERYKPRALVDMATLTGSCAATLGNLASGLMSTDAGVTKRLIAAGEKTGERLWELPMWDEYFDLIKGTFGDIQNISKKYAGAITAGMFLKEFTGHTKAWAHLDIAGTAYNESGSKLLSPIGSTGMGVRLLTRFVQSYK